MTTTPDPTLDPKTDYILRNLPDQLSAIAGILAGAKKWETIERVTSMLNGLAAEVAGDNARRLAAAAAALAPTVDVVDEVEKALAAPREYDLPIIVAGLKIKLAAPTGGKAGKGHNRTSTVQVCANPSPITHPRETLHNWQVRRMFRFDTRDRASRQRAIEKAIAFARAEGPRLFGGAR